MKIKRYVAVSMRAALAQVRTEQGPDAVILSSRRADGGIEVIAAVDYDAALFAGAAQPRASGQSTVPAGTVPDPPTARGAVPAPPETERRKESADAAANTRPAAGPGDGEPGYGAVQREIKDLRKLMQSELAHMSWNDKRLREPLRATVLEQLSAMDIAPDVALSLAGQLPRRMNTRNQDNIPLALLVHQLQVVEKLSSVVSGVFALVGPTGAGKTTTIAKLAANFSLKHGSADLALVSTDGYRIGAREHLMTYARLLGTPVHVANGARELAKLMERLKHKKLVLIDSAGMGPRDPRLGESLAALRLGAAQARVLLTLPAQGDGHTLDEIARSFAVVSPAACILTKVDEAASLGAVISTLLRHQLRIAYVCNGQRVPEDLHAAHARRVWLVRTALQLKQHEQAPADAYLARHFSGVALHA